MFLRFPTWNWNFLPFLVPGPGGAKTKLRSVSLSLFAGQSPLGDVRNNTSSPWISGYLSHLDTLKISISHQTNKQLSQTQSNNGESLAITEARFSFFTQLQTYHLLLHQVERSPWAWQMFAMQHTSSNYLKHLNSWQTLQFISYWKAWKYRLLIWQKSRIKNHSLPSTPNALGPSDVVLHL